MPARQTFNCISIDGDTSTNDTVLLLASGRSGVRLEQPSVRSNFSQALLHVCQSLAEQIVADGEGVGHVVRMSVGEAKNREEALQVARTVAHSLLVKTAWAGADPNWGRILAAVGRSGIAVNPARITIRIGDQTVCRGGMGCVFDQKRAHQDLSGPLCEIGILLGRDAHPPYFSPPTSPRNMCALMPTIRLERVPVIHHRSKIC